MNNSKFKFYPFNHKDCILIDKNCVIIEVLKSYNGKHLCGYVALENKLIPKEWQGDYHADALQYLAIHGGITFCETFKEYTVFGFDCAHAGDEHNKDLRDPNHVMKLTKQMEHLLLSYAECIGDWRKADRETRLNIIDDINKSAQIPCSPGFGAMVGALGGGKEFGSN